MGDYRPLKRRHHSNCGCGCDPCPPPPCGCDDDFGPRRRRYRGPDRFSFGHRR